MDNRKIDKLKAELSQQRRERLGDVNFAIKDIMDNRKIDNLKAELSHQRRERLGDVHVNFCGAIPGYRNMAKERSSPMRPGGDRRQQQTAPATERSRSATEVEEERLGSMLKDRFDHNSCTLQRFRTSTLRKMEKNLTPWQKKWDKFDMIELARKFEADNANEQGTYSTDINLSLLAPNNSVQLYKVGTFAPEAGDGCAGAMVSMRTSNMEQLYDTKKYMDNRNQPQVDIAVQRVPSKRTLQFASDLVKRPPSKESVVEEDFGYGHPDKEVQQQQTEIDNVQQRLNALREVGTGAHGIGSSSSSQPPNPPPYLSSRRGSLNKGPHRDSKNNKLRGTSPMQLIESGEDIDKYAIFMHQDISRNPSGNGCPVYKDVMASGLKTRDSPLKRDLEKLDEGRWPGCAEPLKNTIDIGRIGNSSRHNAWNGQDRFNCETTTYSSNRGIMQPEGMDPKGRDRDRDMSKQQGSKRESYSTRRSGRASKTRNMEFGVDHQEAKEEHQPSMNYEGLFPNNKRLEDHVDSNFINLEDKNLSPRLSSSSRPEPTFEYEISVECYDSQQVNRLQAAILKSSRVLNESVIQPPKKLNKMQENHIRRHSSYPKKSPSRPILLYKLLLKCSVTTQIKMIYGALLESSIVLNSCVYSSKGNECVPLSRMRNIVEPAEMMITPNYRGSSSSSNHARCIPPSMSAAEDQRDHLQTHLSWPCKEVAPKGTGPHWWNEMRKSNCVVGQDNNDQVTLPSEDVNDRFKVTANCTNRGGIGEDAISSWRGHVDESIILAGCGEKGQLSRQLFDELSLLESLFSQCEGVSQAQCKDRRIRFPECLQVPAKASDNLQGTQPRDDQLHKEDKNHQTMALKMMLPYIQRSSCNPEHSVALEDPFCRPSTSLAVNVSEKSSQRSSTITEVVPAVQVESATVATTTAGVEIPDVILSTAVPMEEMMLTSVSKPDIDNQIADIFACDDAHLELPPTSALSDTRHEVLPMFASSAVIGQQIADTIANAPTNIDATSDTHDLCGPSVCLLPSAMGVHFGDDESGQSNVDKQNSTLDHSDMSKESSFVQLPEIGVQTSSVTEDETFLGWLARATGINVTSNASQTSPCEPDEEYLWWPRIGVSVQIEIDEPGSKTLDNDAQQQEQVDTSQNETQSAWWNPFTSLQGIVSEEPKSEPTGAIEVSAPSTEQRKSILNSYYEEILTESQGSPQTESKKSFTTEILPESGDPRVERTSTETQSERKVSLTTQDQPENGPQIESNCSRTDDDHAENIPETARKSLTIKNQPESSPQSDRRMTLTTEINPEKSLTIVDQPESNPQTARTSLPSEENPQTARRMSLPAELNPSQAARRVSLPPIGENPPAERRKSATTVEKLQSNQFQSTERIRISGTTQDHIPENNNPQTARKNSSTTETQPESNLHIKVKPETSDNALETNLGWIPYFLGTSTPRLEREFGNTWNGDHRKSMDTLGEIKRESVTRDVQTIGRVGTNIQTSNQCEPCEEPAESTGLPSDDKNTTSSSSTGDNSERSNRKLPYLGKHDVKNLQPNSFGRCTTFDSSHRPSKAPPTMQGKQVSEISQASKIECETRFDLISDPQDLTLPKRLAMASRCTSSNMGALKMEDGHANIFGIVPGIDGVNYKLSYVSPELLQNILQSTHVGGEAERMQKYSNNASLDSPFSLSITRESQEDMASKQSMFTKKRKLSTPSQTKLSSQPIIDDKSSDGMTSNFHENGVDSHVIDSSNNEIPQDSIHYKAPPKKIDRDSDNNPSSRLEWKSMSPSKDNVVDKPMTNVGQIVCSDCVNHENIDHTCLQSSHIDDSGLENGQLQLSIVDPPNNQQFEMNLGKKGPSSPKLQSNKPPRRIVTRTSFMTSLASNVRALVNVKQTSGTSSSV